MSTKINWSEDTVRIFGPEKPDGLRGSRLLPAVIVPNIQVLKNELEWRHNLTRMKYAPANDVFKLQSAKLGTVAYGTKADLLAELS